MASTDAGCEKMILTDNETKLDLLNNEAIAKTIVKLFRANFAGGLGRELVKLEGREQTHDARWHT